MGVRASVDDICILPIWPRPPGQGHGEPWNLGAKPGVMGGQMASLPLAAVKLSA